jgi:hypothetical protein
MVETKFHLLFDNNFDTQGASTVASCPIQNDTVGLNTPIVKRETYELHEIDIDTDKQFCLYINKLSSPKHLVRETLK